MSASPGVEEGPVVGSWDADARFTDLVSRRRGDLLRLAVLMTGNRHEAEDAVQEAVLSVSRSWLRVLVSASEPVVYSYLRTAVARKSIDVHRTRMPVGEVPELPIEDAGFLRLEADRSFFALVAALPPQQRAVLVLRYYADLDDRRIAAIVGSTRATVRSNAMRGLEKLRAQLRTETDR